VTSFCNSDRPVQGIPPLERDAIKRNRIVLLSH
jgi:hypothetical protein